MKRPTQKKWEDIPGYEELYEMSNFGVIRSKKTGKIKKPVKRKDRKVRQVHLYDGSGGRKTHNLPRLMYKTFFPEKFEENKDRRFTVKNGNHTDLFPENIQVGYKSRPTITEFAKEVLNSKDMSEVRTKCLTLLSEYG